VTPNPHLLAEAKERSHHIPCSGIHHTPYKLCDICHIVSYQEHQCDCPDLIALPVSYIEDT
jgi:hypothetical protein